MWLKRIGVAVLVLAAMLGIRFALEMFLYEYYIRIITLTCINAILAVGLNLINGTTGQFSIGHAGFMAVGAYATAVTVVALENTIGPSLAGLPQLLFEAAIFLPGLAVGAIFAGIAGLAVGIPSLRLRGDYLAIVTLGFGEIIRLLFNNAQSLGGATGYSGGRPIGLSFYSNLFWVGSITVGVILLIRNLTYSTHGRALSAIREDETAAESSGIPTVRMKVTAFVISAMATGIAGGLFAQLQSRVRPDDFRLDKSVDMLVMIIVGGLGSVTGAILGAIFVSVTLELMRDAQDLRLVIYAALLVILMIVRPEGMLGRRELGPVLRSAWRRLRGQRA